NAALASWSVAVPLILALGHWVFLSPTGSIGSPVVAATATNPATAASLADLDADILWERSLTKDYAINQAVGQAVAATQDGGYLLAGRGYFGPKALANIFIMKVDPDGNQQWIRTLSEENAMRDEFVADLYSFPNGSYLMAGFDRNYFGEQAGNFHLLKLDGPNLETAWESRYALENLSNYFTVQTESSGDFTLYMWSGLTIQALRVPSTSSGQGEWSEAVELKGLSETDTIVDLKPVEEGGFILAGVTSDSAGGFKDALLAKASVDGNIEWRQTYGGDKSEEVFKVLRTKAGEYLFIGRATPRTIEDGDLYLIKVDATGKLLWEKTFGGSEVDEGARDGLLTEGDGLVALGSWSAAIYLANVDANGDLVWEKYFRNKDVKYDIWSFCQSTDGGYAIISSRSEWAIDSVIIKFKKK
ncbi:MAG: hypothetical protein MUO64_18020, partial [Anaerolineales bacterium]|nr:hypothetical protein [Anaerolineales bacterium]